MKMKHFFLVFSFGFLCLQEVLGDEIPIKTSAFPYMAFIYFPDTRVIDVNGLRFVRSAVLIRRDWLVTSALGPAIINAPEGYPRKTLMARAGAVSIDADFFFNEEQEEQEREIIQIIRPSNHSATQWWTTDISLLKTLMPFNITPTVDFIALSLKQNVEDKSCFILVYAKNSGNETESKQLTQLFVDLLPPSVEECGTHFSKGTMICAADSKDNKNTLSNTNYCQGNSGGPLVCGDQVIGLQTYVDNDCEQPHLYQILAAWSTFITCGIEDKCHDVHCTNTCDIIQKDSTSGDSDLINPTLQDLIDNETGTTKEEVTPTSTSESRTTESEEQEADVVPTHTSDVTNLSEANEKSLIETTSDLISKENFKETTNTKESVTEFTEVATKIETQSTEMETPVIQKLVKVEELGNKQNKTMKKNMKTRRSFSSSSDNLSFFPIMMLKGLLVVCLM